MGHTSRRLLTGAALVLAAGAGAAATPVAVHAAGIAVTVDVDRRLTMRSGPSLTSAVAGTLRDGQRVTVDCSVIGQQVRGKVRTTDQWNRLRNGRYVSHAYTLARAAIPPCSYTATVRSSDGAVNVRSGPSPRFAVVRTVADGTQVRVVCAVQGTRVAGTIRTTSQWDRLTDGRYISHAYVLSAVLKACPDPPPDPGPALTPEQFIAAAVPGAQKGWREYGVPPSVTIAQAILESGWGRSGLSSVDRNYFGIKCQNGYYGPHATGCHVVTTTECDKAGNCFPTRDAFRTYATMARSFRDHGHFLRVNKRYAPAFAHTNDANKFLMAVWKAGYATDPNYYTKVTNIMSSYDLYRYDTRK